MEAEDLEPRRKVKQTVPLDRLSIEDLSDYRAELEAEIARVDGAIKDRRGHIAAAEAMFRKPE
jgi:uncharacterized small protein (DUF1192 family)